MLQNLKRYYINPINIREIEWFVECSAQTTILVGPRGFGLTQLVKQLLSESSFQFVEITDSQQHGLIGVDDISIIRQIARSKYQQKNFLIISNAQNLTVDAQNALLKNLEEPNYNLHYVLLTDALNQILPTITSRAQIIRLHKITTPQSEYILQSHNILDKKEQAQIMVMASGLPYEISRLSSDYDYFQKRTQEMADAKIFIEGKLYSSMLKINKYKTSRDSSIQLLEDSLKLIEFSLKNNARLTIINKINPLILALHSIRNGGNCRIQLLSTVLE